MCNNPTNCPRWQFVANYTISLPFIAQHVIDKKLVLSLTRLSFPLVRFRFYSLERTGSKSPQIANSIVLYYISDNQSGSPKNCSFPEPSLRMRRKKLAGSGNDIGMYGKSRACTYQRLHQTFAAQTLGSTDVE